MFVKSYPQKDGSYISINWTVGNYITANLFGYFTALIFLFWCVFVIPIIFFFVYFVSEEEERFAQKLLVIAASIYFFVDYHNGYIGTSFLHVFLGDALMFILAKIIFAIGLCFIGLLFFDRKLFEFGLKDNPMADNSAIVRGMFLYCLAFVVMFVITSKGFVPSLITLHPLIVR